MPLNLTNARYSDTALCFLPYMPVCMAAKVPFLCMCYSFVLHSSASNVVVRSLPPLRGRLLNLLRGWWCIVSAQHQNVYEYNKTWKVKTKRMCDLMCNLFTHSLSPPPVSDVTHLTSRPSFEPIALLRVVEC